MTVRYGGRRQRYHTYAVDAPDAGAAMEAAARQLPAEIRPQADLVEIRTLVDPDARAYVGE